MFQRRDGMRTSTSVRTPVAALVTAAFIALTLLSVNGLTAGVVDDAAGKVRLTPPAPIIDEAQRKTELSRRRAQVAAAIGNKHMLVLFSAEPRVYARDVNYEFRQENNLFYLTNLNQPNATLVLMPGNPKLPEILFLPRRSPAAETWTGHMYSPEEANRISGVKEIWAATEFEPFMRAIANRQPYFPKAEQILFGATFPEPIRSPHGYESLLGAANQNDALIFLLLPREKESQEYKLEQRFASDWSRTESGYAIRSASRIFGELRLRKSPLELKLLQHAIDITIEAQQRAWLAALTAKWEYEVDAHIVSTFKLRNADHWGYPSIVGCGPNATTLHYIESQGEVKPGDLLLMDVGAEYQHYTADVTRTIPVSGKFTPAQAKVYQIVYDAQEAAAQATRPGALISDVQRAATEVVKNGLLKIGLITDLDSEQYRIWFMHGTSHWLGMNVHDVGDYGTKLEPGMVFTNEPGVYVRPDALDYLPHGWKVDEWDKFKTAIRPAFEKYKGMGVRIEDDLLVTADGRQWMTAPLPRKMAEIEAFLAKGR
jgi:Xaa-Pro aminopeptidase